MDDLEADRSLVPEVGDIVQWGEATWPVYRVQEIKNGQARVVMVRNLDQFIVVKRKEGE